VYKKCIKEIEFFVGIFVNLNSREIYICHLKQLRQVFPIPRQVKITW